MSAVHGDFDLFNGGLSVDRVLREIQSNQPPSIRNESWMKFCMMIELAGRLQREEEIDTDDVNEFSSLVGMKAVDLMKNAEACMEGQGKFAIMSQLSAMLKRGNVDDDVVVEMAARCGMKKEDLLKGANAFEKGTAKGRSKGTATNLKNGQVSWDDRFDELVAYKTVNGDCKVPTRYEANQQLGDWVNHQRRQYKLLMEGKSSQLTSERIERLTNVGFVWVITKWDDRFDELVAYKAVKGNCKVPSSYAANPQLGRWVKTQRRWYKEFMAGKPSQLTAERIERLTNVGFVWELKEQYKSWDERFEELKQYKNKNGNCNVPNRYKANPQLGTWVDHQRQAYKKGKLSSEQIEKLTRIGFAWKLSTAKRS